jgi:hypothetical protein
LVSEIDSPAGLGRTNIRSKSCFTHSRKTRSGPRTRWRYYQKKQDLRRVKSTSGRGTRKRSSFQPHPSRKNLSKMTIWRMRKLRGMSLEGTAANDLVTTTGRLISRRIFASYLGLTLSARLWRSFPEILPKEASLWDWRLLTRPMRRL